MTFSLISVQANAIVMRTIQRIFRLITPLELTVSTPNPSNCFLSHATIRLPEQPQPARRQARTTPSRPARHPPPQPRQPQKSTSPAALTSRRRAPRRAATRPQDQPNRRLLREEPQRDQRQNDNHDRTPPLAPRRVAPHPARQPLRPQRGPAAQHRIQPRRPVARMAQNAGRNID